MNQSNHYDILEIDQGDTEYMDDNLPPLDKTVDFAIRNTYFALMRLHHPDKGGTREKAALINRAYEMLKTRNQRMNYKNSQPPVQQKRRGNVLSTSLVPLQTALDLADTKSMMTVYSEQQLPLLPEISKGEVAQALSRFIESKDGFIYAGGDYKAFIELHKDYGEFLKNKCGGVKQFCLDMQSIGFNWESGNTKLGDKFTFTRPAISQTLPVAPAPKLFLVAIRSPFK